VVVVVVCCDPEKNIKVKKTFFNVFFNSCHVFKKVYIKNCFQHFLHSIQIHYTTLSLTDDERFYNVSKRLKKNFFRFLKLKKIFSVSYINAKKPIHKFGSEQPSRGRNKKLTVKAGSPGK